MIAWLHVAEVGAEAGVTVKLSYETSPFEDELLFSPMAGPLTVATGVTVTSMLADVSPPLAKYFRWKVQPSGPTTSVWDITFRILIAVNQPGYRTPTYSGMAGGVNKSIISSGSAPLSVPVPPVSRDSAPALIYIPKKKL